MRRRSCRHRLHEAIVLLALYSDQPAKEILSADAIALFEKLGLKEHPTAQRSKRLPLDGRAHPPERPRGARCEGVSTEFG